LVGYVGKVGMVIIIVSVVKIKGGLEVTEQEVREALKGYRWSFLRRSRKSHDYVYAARKAHGRRREVYICSLASLESMTVEVLVEKLTRACPT